MKLAYFVGYELYFDGAFNGGGNSIMLLPGEIKTLADVRKLEELISEQTAARTKQERQHVVVMSFIRLPDEDKTSDDPPPETKGPETKGSHLKRIQ